ncbi:hypothetical protein ASPCAL12645 [Aspergillus calidoustus]|uniref:Integrase catalytic domain-containing protein n=1 Tax=Aspergillus calidoustus TaxID=454130 RepID=A0A0U5GCM2_ASPCI|nr:hypothetical protein ASPCAL12645 [Aspergillus calidoustus]
MTDNNHTANQAYCRGRAIPTELTRTIPAVQKVLASKDQFDTWTFAVKDSLRALRLEQLIQKDIARPAQDAANYAAWEDMSLQVASWLTGQVSEEYQRRLQSYSKNIDMADDRYEAIKDIALGSGTLRLKAAALKPIKMTRQQFASPADYMKAYMAATMVAERLKCDAGPYVSALLLIHELRDDMPNWAYNKQEQMTEEPGTFNYDHFRELYDSAMATWEASNVEISAAAHRAPRPNNQNNNNSSDVHNPMNDPAHHGRKLQDGPAPGCKHDHWRQTILNGTPQTTDGRCTYCGMRGHSVKKCWYLMPDLRREGWRPWRTIWAYKYRYNHDDEKPKNSPSVPDRRQSQNTANNPQQTAPPAPPPTGQGGIAVTYDADGTAEFRFAGAAVDMPLAAKAIRVTTNEQGIQQTAVTSTAIWIVDSGASQHLIGNRALFKTLYEYGPNEQAYRHKTAGGGIVSAKGYGTANVRLYHNGACVDREISAYYNPDLDFNMLSTEKMKQDMRASWSSKDLYIRDWDTNDILGSTYNFHGVPRVIVFPNDDLILAALNKKQKKEKQHNMEQRQLSEKTAEEDEKVLTHEEILLAHRRLGHIGLPKLRKALNNNKIESFVCDVCRENKARRQVSREPQNLRSLDEGDPAALWYADVQTVTPKGVGGEVMYVVAVNAATRMTICLLIKEKKHAADAMIAFTKHLKVQTGQYPREILLDGGTEFFRFRRWAKRKGIKVNPTPPRTPEPNTSERFGGYVNEMARCILDEAGLPWKLWPYAIENVAHTINRLHRPNDKDKRPPIQKWREWWRIKDPHASIEHLKVFGCRAWVHIPAEDRVKSQKMSPRAHIGYYVGTEGDHGHVYRVWVPKTGRIHRSRDVTFDESRLYNDDHDDHGIPIEEPSEDEIPEPGKPFTITVQPGIPNTEGLEDQGEEQMEQNNSGGNTGEEDDVEGGAETPTEADLHLTPPESSQPQRQQGPFTPDSPTPAIFRNASGEPSRRALYNASRRGARGSSRGLVRLPLPRPLTSFDRLPIQEGAINPQRVPESTNLWEISHQNTSPRGTFANEEDIRTTNRLNLSDYPRIAEQALQQSEEMELDEDMGEAEELHHVPNPVVPQKRNISSRFIEPVGAEKNRKLDDVTSADARGKQIRTSTRTTKGQPPGWLGNEQALAALDVVEPNEVLRASEVVIPQTYKQAMKSKHADRWWAAMKRQYDEITGMETYRKVSRPKHSEGHYVLPGKWVYALKLNKENRVQRFKARWVICGNRQRPGVDFDDTSSPVPTDPAIRMFLTMIATKKKRCKQVDIVTAFLYAMMKERKIFMRPPPGFEDDDDQVWLLLKALYGLRQAGHLWWKRISEKLIAMGFKPLVEEPCIFQRGTTYIIIYVDDLLVTDDTDEGIDEVIREINDDMQVKVIGEPARFLGCALTRENDTIIMDQKGYTEDLLIEHEMSSSNGADSPMASGYRQHRMKIAKHLAAGETTVIDTDAVEDDLQEPNEPYASLLGQLNWLVVKTRPDIAYAVFRLQRYMQKPLTYDVKAAKRILRYLRSNNLALQLGLKPEEAEEVYVDAAHQDHESGHSTASFIIFYAGAPVAWSARKETVLAPSSTIAELIAFDAAVKEALYIRKLAVALGMRGDDKPLRILSDSDNAIKMVKKPNLAATPSVRWLDNRWFFVHELVQDKKIEFQHIDGVKNTADGLTKPLDGPVFNDFKKRLHMVVYGGERD